MKYQMTDGTIVEANTAQELVGKLHAASHTPSKDDATWMLEVADRVLRLSGDKIRTDDPKSFIYDMLLHKMITVIEMTGELK